MYLVIASIRFEGTIITECASIEAAMLTKQGFIDANSMGDLQSVMVVEATVISKESF